MRTDVEQHMATSVRGGGADDPIAEPDRRAGRPTQAGRTFTGTLVAVDPAVLVPLKAFRHAKGRLAGHYSTAERHRLAAGMAGRVVRAAAPLRVYVACDDDEVATWSESVGADVLWGPGLGLNGAIDQGVATIAGKGHDHVVILHGDLPLAHELGSLVWPDEIVIVPDRRCDGTNVLSRPTRCPVPAAYGGGSFARHHAAAVATGVPVTVRHDPLLQLDIDTVADCRHPLVAETVRALVWPRDPGS